jgi:hypothetical protein
VVAAPMPKELKKKPKPPVSGQRRLAEFIPNGICQGLPSSACGRLTAKSRCLASSPGRSPSEMPTDRTCGSTVIGPPSLGEVTRQTLPAVFSQVWLVSPPPFAVNMPCG